MDSWAYEVNNLLIHVFITHSLTPSLSLSLSLSLSRSLSLALSLSLSLSTSLSLDSLPVQSPAEWHGQVPHAPHEGHAHVESPVDSLPELEVPQRIMAEQLSSKQAVAQEKGVIRQMCRQASKRTGDAAGRQEKGQLGEQ